MIFGSNENTKICVRNLLTFMKYLVKSNMHRTSSKIWWLHWFQHFTYCSELCWLLCHKSTKYCFSPKCKYVMQTGNSRLPKSATHSYVLRSRLLNKFERASLSKHSFKRSIMSKFLLFWRNIWLKKIETFLLVKIFRPMIDSYSYSVLSLHKRTKILG